MATEEAPIDARAPAPWRIDAGSARGLTGGTLDGAEAVEIRGACIDSRRVHPGALFCCIKGERTDGHDHARAAVERGAALVLASRPLHGLGAPTLLVPDVTLALGAIARAARAARAATVWIGVTGSSGKTTVKELIASACGADAPTYATPGNMNNHFGVPLSVLGAPAEARYAVIEMGANHRGEIAALARISQPQIGVVTSVGPAHLEGFGGIAGVALGKSELFAALPADGAAFLGASGLEQVALAFGATRAELLAPFLAAAAGRRLSVVEGATGTVDGDGIELRTAHGSARIALLGAHNLANAELAFRVALAAGVPPAAALAGLSRARPVGGRLDVRTCGAHRILDDSYNANPGSMAAALRALALQPHPIAVLGAMGELGADRERGHRLVGEEAARLRLPIVVVGEAAHPIAAAYRAAGGDSCTEAVAPADAVAALAPFLARGPATVLVKASRSAALERVVAALLAAEGGSAC